MTLQVTDDEHVDVATHIVVAACVRSEDERIADGCLPLEDRAQLGDETNGACVKVAESRIDRVRRIHPPHAKRTDASTLNNSLPQQLLKRELNRPGAALNS